MKYLWNITADEYFEIVELAKKHGKKAGDSMEAEFLQVMKNKNKKPVGATELTTEELMKEQASHGKSVLSIETDETGKQKYKIVKPKKDKKDE